MATGKKILSLVLSIMLVIGAFPVATFGQMSHFEDMPNDWSTHALQRAVENGLLRGYNHRIMPSEHLTRAEMSAIMSRAFDAQVEADISVFQDVSSGQWFASDVAKAYQMGIMQGHGGLMRPNDPITREEAFVIIARAIQLDPEPQLNRSFNDASNLSLWARGEVNAMVNAGYVSGYNGMLNPKGYITRAEFAQVMENVFKMYYNVPGEFQTVRQGNVVINHPDVTLKDMVINGDLIIADGVGDGDIILENVEVTGRVIVRGGGENSLHLKGNSSVGHMFLARREGGIRIKIDPTATLLTLHVNPRSNNIFISGNIQHVNIRENVQGIDFTLESGTINTMDIQGNTRNISVKGNGRIVQITVFAGSGEISITTPGTRIIVRVGAGTVRGGGGRIIAPGTTVSNDARGTGIATPPGTSPGTPSDPGTPATPQVAAVVITTTPASVTAVPNADQVQVAFSTSTEGVDFRVTLDGSNPTASTATTGSSITVSSENLPNPSLGGDLTLKVIATKSGMTPSAVAEKVITFAPAATVQVSTAAELAKAANLEGVQTIQFTNDITSDLALERLVDVDFAGFTLTGSVAIETEEQGTMELKGGGTITGNLTIDAKNATVINDATVQGTTTIIAVSDQTFESTGQHQAGLRIEGRSRIRLSGAASATDVEVATNEPVTLSGSYTGAVRVSAENARTRIDDDATVATLTVSGSGAKIEVAKNAIVTQVSSTVSGVQVLVEDGGTNPEITGDASNITIVKAFRVTFDKNSGNTPANPTYLLIASGSAITVLPEPPSKVGKRFTGWNTKADGSGLDVDEDTLVTESMTVYAQWIEIKIKNHPTQAYYAPGETLSFTMEGFEEGEVVRFYFPIFIGPDAPPWASNYKILDTMLEAADGTLYYQATANSSGVVTIEGEVESGLPFGVFNITLPAYDISIENPIELTSDKNEQVRLGRILSDLGISVDSGSIVITIDELKDSEGDAVTYEEAKNIYKLDEAESKVIIDFGAESIELSLDHPALEISTVEGKTVITVDMEHQAFVHFDATQFNGHERVRLRLRGHYRNYNWELEEEVKPLDMIAVAIAEKTLLAAGEAGAFTLQKDTNIKTHAQNLVNAKVSGVTVSIGESTDNTVVDGDGKLLSSGAVQFILNKGDYNKAVVIQATATDQPIDPPPTTTPSAIIADVTIQITSGAAITTTTGASITLTDGTFEDITIGEDIAGWFQNLPDGITVEVTSVSTDGKTITFTFSGTPESNVVGPMVILIPAEVLVDWEHELLVTSNPDAKFVP